ncbi:hypothetical protein [Massilia rubra]|uniref:Uncharacterized protein n=1 Tax=Massilia rubra TaxID=2607910 RepID=A0ABX0LRI5_9BURK|nr:hypothetical protein [Massilia rubra]NHZ37468.1 hypothetical protein [Massilia rubra]
MLLNLKSAALISLLAAPLACAQTAAVPPPDNFGTALAPGLDAKAIIALIAPGRDASLATLVGARAWPYRPNTYVAIACFARNKKEFDAERSEGNLPGCRQYRDRLGENEEIGKAVYLGVVAFAAGGAQPALVASYGKALDIETGWNASALARPIVLDDAVRAGRSTILPEEYIRFDFAPYKISATQTAIGVRVGWNERYTGVGMGSFDALSLFRIDGGKLVNILSEPIAFETDSNDGYDADGNRKGIVREGGNVLTILPGNTGGYHDLQLKTLKGRWKKTFVWDSAASRYMPAPLAKQR